MGWRDEILLDVQTTHPYLNVAQQKIVSLVTKVATGVVITCSATAELAAIAERRRRDREAIKQ